MHRVLYDKTVKNGMNNAKNVPATGRRSRLEAALLFLRLLHRGEAKGGKTGSESGAASICFCFVEVSRDLTWSLAVVRRLLACGGSSLACGLLRWLLAEKCASDETLLRVNDESETAWHTSARAWRVSVVNVNRHVSSHSNT